MRNALAYVPKGQQSMVSAALRQAFIQPDRAGAAQTLRHVADQLRAKWPKLGDFIDDSEADVLAHLDFPAQHRTKIHSTDEIDKAPVEWIRYFLFGRDVPFSRPGQVPDDIARSGGQGWPQATAQRRSAPLIAASTARPWHRPGTNSCRAAARSGR